MAVPTGIASAAREAAGWLVIGLTLFGCVYFFTDIRALTRQVTGIELDASSEERGGADEPRSESEVSGFDREVHLEAAENGHFFSEIMVNGRSLSAVVDTGATGVSLTYEDAEAIGLRLTEADYTYTSQTANGTTRIAPVRLEEVRIGDIVVRDVEAFVAEPGKLFQTLLGMSFLGRLSHIEMRGRELVLVQ